HGAGAGAGSVTQEIHLFRLHRLYRPRESGYAGYSEELAGAADFREMAQGVRRPGQAVVVFTSPSALRVCRAPSKAERAWRLFRRHVVARADLPARLPRV